MILSIRSNESEDSESESGDTPFAAEIFEDYSPPNYEQHQGEEVTIDSQFVWILLWIMNF